MTTRHLLAGVLLALPAIAAAQQQSAATVSCPVPVDTCAAKTRPDEVTIVMLGDSGFGEGGSSEWGSHAQAAVAKQMRALCPRPDLVFLLGDNIYWKGSPDLFGPRFDQMYRDLLDPDRHRVHSALGNHDVKGCALTAEPGFPAGGTCADALRRALAREEPSQNPDSPEDTTSWLVPDVGERAREVPASACPAAFESAYEQDPRSGGQCYAGTALRHGPFGYAVFSGSSLRYYTVDWAPVPETSQPAVRVLVADSNTLEVEGAVPQEQAKPDAPRRDTLQTLWMENQLRTAPKDAWTFVTMHHPPYTPTGCAFKLAGRCMGGHADEQALSDQLRPVLAPAPPDFVFTAHNHFYARTRALDPQGYPSTARESIRYFVTGGGGAPLYRMQPPHRRFARAGAFHHFVYLRLRRDEAFFWTIDDRGKVRDSGCLRKGDPVDRCIAHGGYEDAALACGNPAPEAGCPASPPK